MKRLVLAVILVLPSCVSKDDKLQQCWEKVGVESFYWATPIGTDGAGEVYVLDSFLIEKRSERDMQIIDFDCAVVINSPPIKMIDPFQEENNESIRLGAQHLAAVRCMIEVKGIPTVTVTQGIVRFISSDEKWDVAVENEILTGWNFILFKKGSKPKILPSVYVTIEEVDRYFNIENRE